MTLRQDALCAAAEFILAVERTGIQHSDAKLVATVGKLNVKPNSSNVIPGSVTHSLDLRSPNSKFLENICNTLRKIASNIAQRRGLKCDWNLMQSSSAAVCDNRMKQILGNSIQNHVGRLIEIPSGAGHDAAMISKVAPACMLFIRCKDGISHNPLEYASPEDIGDALDVSYDFILSLAQKCAAGEY